MILWLNWGEWKIDLTALYFAAQSWWVGLPDLIYQEGPATFLVDPPSQWVDWAHAEGWTEPYFTPFLYPPLWAVLLSPVAGALTVVQFFNAGLIVNVAASVWMVWLGWKLVEPRELSPTLWALLSFGLLFTTAAGYMTYWLGQPQVIVSALTLASVLALAQGRDLPAGGLLALAAAAKLSPAFLVVLFVMERRWRALAAFTVAGALLAGLSVVLAGWPLHAELLEKLAQIEARTLVSRILVSLELVLFQLHETLLGTANWVIGHPRMPMEPVWIAWTVRLALFAAVAVTHVSTRDLPPRLRLWMRFYLLLLATLVTNPLGWMHYMALPLALLPALFEILERRPATLALLAVGVVYSMPLFLLLAPLDYAGFAQVGLSFAAVTGLFFLVASAAKRHRAS